MWRNRLSAALLLVAIIPLSARTQNSGKPNAREEGIKIAIRAVLEA